MYKYIYIYSRLFPLQTYMYVCKSKNTQNYMLHKTDYPISSKYFSIIKCILRTTTSRFYLIDVHMTFWLWVFYVCSTQSPFLILGQTLSISGSWYIINVYMWKIDCIPISSILLRYIWHITYNFTENVTCIWLKSNFSFFLFFWGGGVAVPMVCESTQGQGSSPCHSSDLSRCSDPAVTCPFLNLLCHRELQKAILKKKIET